MSLQSIVIFALITIGLGDIVVLYRSIRTRVSFTHPRCAQCGYELFGLPVGTARCPECGSDLSVPGARSQFERRPRPARLAMSIALLFVIGGGVFESGRICTALRAWRVYAPGDVLIWEFQTAGANPEAIFELQRRLASGRLSDSQIDSCVRFALTRQADLKAEWNPAWGDWVEEARQLQKVKDAAWEQYLSNAVMPLFSVRPSVGRDDAPVYQFVEPPTRSTAGITRRSSAAGPVPRLGWRTVMRTLLSGTNADHHVALDGNTTGEFGAQYEGPRELNDTSNGPLYRSFYLFGNGPGHFAEGQHRLDVDCAVELFLSGGPGAPGGSPAPLKGHAKVSQTFTVIPQDHVAAVQGSDMMRPSIKARAFSGDGQQRYTIFFQHLPAAFAGEIAIWHNGKRLEATTGLFFPRNYSGSRVDAVSAPDAVATIRPGDAVSIVFTPDPASARLTVDDHPAWIDSLNIDDVIVEQYHPWR